MIETKIAEILEKYDATIAVVAILSNLVLFILKKKITIPRRLNSFMPFVAAIALCFCIYPFAGAGVEQIAKNAVTAGGLASVLYSLTGGYYSEEKEDLKKLLSELLKNVVSADKIDEIICDFFDDASLKNSNEQLIIVKVSDLIKKNLNGDVSEDRVELVTAVFVEAWKKLTKQTKTST